MKHIGDILRGQPLPEPRAPLHSGTAGPTCPICKGAGWLRLDVPVGHRFFGQAVMCECLIAALEERRFAELQRLSNLEAFRDKRFENFDGRVKGVERAYRAALEFAQDPKGWLVLIGPYGCGKTHLAAAIANYAVECRQKVLFTVVPDLLDHLRATFAPTSEVRYDDLFEAVRTTPLLILDDLGTESGTPWAREKLYQIFNHRYNDRLPTVITTNRRPEAIDERIWSRMNDRALSQVIEITAGDYRQRPLGERLRPTTRRPAGPLPRPEDSGPAGR
jgi:DNA replication protein DnaC